MYRQTYDNLKTLITLIDMAEDELESLPEELNTQICLKYDLRQMYHSMRGTFDRLALEHLIELEETYGD